MATKKENAVNGKKYENTVENCMVKNIKYRFYRANQRGYIFINGQLVYVTVQSVLFDLRDCSFVSVLASNDGHIYQINGEYQMFSNTEHYKNNAPIEQSLYSTWELLRMANIKRLHECPVTDKEIVDPQTGVAEKFVCLTPWVFEDGQPKQEPIAIYTVQCVSENEYGEDWVLIDGELPANNYDCREDALSFNEYKVIDDDGEEFVEQGIQKRLAPTKKQWDALKKLKEAYEECRNLGLRFFWDRDYNGNVQCINGEHICDFGYEHDFRHENGAEEVRMDYVVFADTGISFYDYDSNDSCYGIAMKATPRQTKQWEREHPDGKED